MLEILDKSQICSKLTARIEDEVKCKKNSKIFDIQCHIDSNYTFLESFGPHEHNSYICHDVEVNLAIRSHMKAQTAFFFSISANLLFLILFQFVIFRIIRICYFPTI